MPPNNPNFTDMILLILIFSSLTFWTPMKNPLRKVFFKVPK
jgi:hypothetical protein